MATKKRTAPPPASRMTTSSNEAPKLATRPDNSENAKNRSDTNAKAESVTIAAPQSGLDTDAVARRAYERFLARGGEHGNDLEDWLAAEDELRKGSR